VIDLDRQHGETVTGKLPPEILIGIFSLLGRNSRDLERVTAACGRWRAIAVQIPYLWTTIVIDLKELDKKQAQKLLSRVDLFLSRAGDLRLDVEWHTGTKSEFLSLFHTLFKQKGTFNRWRTLTLEMEQTLTFPSGDIREVDKFSSLEYLKFVSTPSLSFLRIINATASTKLRMLELGSRFRCSPTFPVDYSRILGLISTLHIWSRVVLPKVTIPSNITTLQAYMQPEIPMPHVRHLFLKKLFLESFSSFCPENLVTLMIHVSITRLVDGKTISLPRLLWLGFRGAASANIGVFKVPSLHTLSVKWEGKEAQSFDGPVVTGLRSSFEAPKLLILFLDIFLDGQSTLEILKQFPDISRVDLYFYDTKHALDTLSNVFPDHRDITVCPNLDFLRVILTASPSAVGEWKQSVRKTASNIGEPFWRLESKWPDGRYSKFISRGGTQQKVPCIHPWLPGG
jgi:F-box-like